MMIDVGGPTITLHWVNVSCLLDNYLRQRSYVFSRVGLFDCLFLCVLEGLLTK